MHQSSRPGDLKITRFSTKIRTGSPQDTSRSAALETEGRGHWLGLDSVRLRERRPRVKAYGHDKDHDWRQQPKKY